MILHLLFDDKFSDYVISQFAAKEMQSDFVLVSHTRNLTHFHHADKVRVVNPYVESELEQLLADIKTYSSVVFHGLFYPWQEWLLRRWPQHVKVAWVCWGGEIYGQPDILTSFLKPLSKWIYRQHVWKVGRKKELMFSKNLIQKVNYCLTNVVPEYEYVKNYLGTDIRHLSYNYYSIDETLGSLKDKHCTGCNIMVGNSATIENNYVETLLQLKRVGIGERKIIVPLSYGESWVRTMCVKIGSWLFGNRFEPLVNFMPREEYNTLMTNCAVMIQPHLREQAHGNIVTGLWLGMRVYLSEQGIDYKHFKCIGCKIYSVEKDLLRSNLNAFKPMSAEDMTYNRECLLRIYGQENVVKTIQKVVKELA